MESKHTIHCGAEYSLGKRYIFSTIRLFEEVDHSKI